MQMPPKPLSGVQANSLADLAGDAGWLSAHAVEPNFTLMPQWTLPLAEFCGQERDLRPIHVLAGDGRPGAFSLFEIKRWRWGLPVSHAQSYMGDFPISGTPLLSCSDPAGSCASLLARAFGEMKVPALLLPYLTGHQVVSSVLVDACAEIGAPVRFFDDRERAALRCNGDYDAWFEGTFSRKRRKEFRRLAARLADTGPVENKTRNSGQAGLDHWIDEFLALEQSGWKGAKGTAIGKSTQLTNFLRNSLLRLDNAGKLMCWRLSAGGKPAAMMFGVREGSTCWIVKIAYDEALAKFSPGVLLVLEATRTLFEDDELIFADSCAEPNHPMIDHIWRDRLAVRDVMIGNPNSPAIMFQTLASLESMRRKARTTLKAMLKRRKRK
jgi:hypothetical protein